ncbi:MAG: hypothetical protein ACOVRM_15795, partial [Planctomycetaceae bacterium]
MQEYSREKYCQPQTFAEYRPSENPKIRHTSHPVTGTQHLNPTAFRTANRVDHQESHRFSVDSRPPNGLELVTNFLSNTTRLRLHRTR